ncbi:carbon-monoxide dehydrogenase large subunit [Planomonospora parontospora subsp. parontospora]|uniref:Carbon-monoxide dehydrogenase large subunit n=2 Tax=Planomonospora parontospora TaxID=58119 RepID=A0AA37BJU6_9ACTN|nr:xanthine dehydrogenase family protein molybdopterin-binding subunit [Planomonospora parontospora]GGK82948.1 carbon-monoxide dehydrogenase large subunit [Planomonospora parontospora]GII10403.1 carbon-monoxide dehydrogenase large subunit [Planomonospora parontospora subsp. parontospora]
MTSTPTAPTRTPSPVETGTGRSVGRPLDRVDGTAKTTGAARYAAEHPHPGLAHAALVHAAVTRGRITGIDAAGAEAVPGVLAVITHENAPAMKPPPPVSVLNLSSLASGSSVNYLNTDEVHWNGQPVAVVVAETPEAARHAAGLVRVSYRELPATVDFAAEEGNAVPQKSSALQSGGARKGDAEAALAAAPVSVDLRFTTPPYHHNAIEPHATTAVWDGDRLTVHEGTQNITWLRDHLALRFGVPVRNVRVVAPYVGGAFGGKTMVWAGTVLTVLAARVTGRPVRMALTREGVYRTVGGRTPSAQRVALGARADGTLTALIHTSVTQTGRTGGLPEQATSQSRHLYAAENILLRQNLVELDAVPNTPMRAPGESIGTFALESAVDELACALGLDPIELRMRNEPERNPVDGKRFAHRMLREAYALGAERFGWSGRTPEPGSMRDGGWLVGLGVASAYHPSWQMPANVTVRLSADGSVVVRCGFHEMGMGGATAQAQIAADALGVPFEAVRVEYGDSDLPSGPGAGGSAQTASVAASLLAACEKLKGSLLALARRSGGSPLRGRRPGDLEARDGGLWAGPAGPGETYAAILARAGRDSAEAAVGSDTRVGKVTGQLRFMSKLLRDRRRWVKAACGAHFCEVRVDPDTGEVRVSRWLGVFDVGRVVNAKMVASQLRGGIVMGIGMALSEETLVDPRNGRIMNPGLADYHVPVHADVPPIDVHCLDVPDPTMPLGLLGVGEVSVTGVAAAIANAVRHATGRRVRDLPVTPDKLL